VGKLFNAHSVATYDKPFAAGWTESAFLLDPFTYEYYNATIQSNKDPPVSYPGQYSTDVLAEKAFEFLDDALNGEQPFFMTIAPIAPHSNVHVTEDGVEQSMPRPAVRHEHLFQDAIVPRNPNFNPDRPGGASWILNLPRQTQTNVDFNDEWYRNRLRTLQAVDEMIARLIARLHDADVLDNTYIFFSTDNGYSIGQHRRQPGKQCAFEEDINIPLLVRGPNVPKSHQALLATSHIDLAPTFLRLAGVPELDMAGYRLDGAAIPLHRTELHQAEHNWTQEHINVEMWGIIQSEGKYGYVLYSNHTYKALRIVGDGYDLLYTVWCSNEHELYDMTEDPWQLDNIYGKRSEHISTAAYTKPSTGFVHNRDR
jgi:N-acetylglucosamine-6-sulfatase